jgi:putative transposase
MSRIIKGFGRSLDAGGFEVERIVFPVLALLSHWHRPRYNAQLQLLEAQIRMLRSRIDASRTVPTPAERSELLRLGALIDHDVAEVMHIVRPDTYRRWLRNLSEGKTFKLSGRPHTPNAIRNLVMRFARENLRWGSRRIVGELKKLGIRIGATTVREILHDSGMHPDPLKARKNPPIPWTTFVHAHMESIVAADFFTKKVYTLRGVFTAYVLVFMHLGTRKVYCSPSTYHPDSKWVMQQARNATMWMEDEGIDPRFLIRDRDRKYPASFQGFWKEAGVRSIKIPIRAPKANAFCENFVGTLKKESLNHFICFSRSQLDYIVRTWVAHYLTQRPHRGIGRDDTVLDEHFVPMLKGEVRCRTKLGGIIREYYRKAA